MSAEDKRRRVSLAVVLLCLAAIAAIGPLSWTAMVTESGKIGDGGVRAVCYLLVMIGLCLNGTLMLFLRAVDPRRFTGLALTALACGMVFLGLAYSVFTDWIRESGWDRYVVVAIGAPVVVTLLLTVFSQARERACTGDTASSGAGVARHSRI